MLSLSDYFPYRSLSQIRIQRKRIDRVRAYAILIEHIPVIYVLEVNVVNDEPCLPRILLDGNGLLALPQKLKFCDFIDMNVLLSILHGFDLHVKQLVLPSGNAIH